MCGMQGERGRHILGRVQRTFPRGTGVVADLPGIQVKGCIQEAGRHAVRGERRREQRALEQTVRSMPGGTCRKSASRHSKRHSSCLR